MTLCGSKVPRRANLALVPLTALLLSNVGHAAPSTAITTCAFVITTPGQSYLANDLLGCPGPGISITGQRCPTPAGWPRNPGFGCIRRRHRRGRDQTAILIQGPGTIAGFVGGVSFVNVDFSNVIDVTATGNSVGFSLTRFSQNVIQGNLATENSFLGIEIIGSSENRVVNNLVTNNGDVVLGGLGIWLFGGAALNEVHANIVIGNSEVSNGIVVGLGSTQNNIAGNTALSNGFDMEDANPNCDDNRWRGNRFDTANPIVHSVGARGRPPRRAGIPSPRTKAPRLAARSRLTEPPSYFPVKK